MRKLTVSGISLSMLIAGYFCWDIARGVGKTGGDASPKRTERDDIREFAPASQQVPAVERDSLRPVVGNLPASVKEVSREVQIASAWVDRRERAIKRAQVKSDTLRAFHDVQPRDGWAAEMEMRLRDLAQPEGISFDEVTCRASVCRIVASGDDKTKVMEAVASTSRLDKMKMFSRLIRDVDGKATVESFLSPSGTKWPQPKFEDG